MVPEPLRRELALKAFRHTASYDAAISEWLGGQATVETSPVSGTDDIETPFPSRQPLGLRREMALRYGENPASGRRGLRGRQRRRGVRRLPPLQGKELSWNNLLDADAARKMAALVRRSRRWSSSSTTTRAGSAAAPIWPRPTARAVATDPVSAFGSVIALNRPADGALAEAMADLFVEVLLAPGFDADGARPLRGQEESPADRVPALSAPARDAVELRPIDGGFLAQPPDALPDDPATWTCPTRRQPTAEERRALDLAWRVCATSSRTPSWSPTPIRRWGSAPAR